MKKLFTIGLVAMMSILVFTGCDDDDEYYYDYWYSFGNIVMHSDDRSDGYSIQLDDGTMLVISTNHVPYVDVTDGERIYAQYSIIGTVNDNVSTAGKKYMVDLYGLAEILEKLPIEQSEITTDGEITEASIGNDPIYVTNAWFGSKYLNVEFTIYSSINSTTVHLINLVWDNTRVNESGDNTVYLTLRHNGYTDVPTPSTARWFVERFGRVSFDISEIMPEGETEVPVKLMWVEYGNTWADRVNHYMTGTFKYSPSNTTNITSVAIRPENSQHHFYDYSFKMR